MNAFRHVSVTGILACMIAMTVLFGGRAAAQTAAKARTQYVEVQGAKIAFRTIGEGSSLLLATRMRGTLDTWDPLFLDQLAKTHRVITFDYPGIGYSSGALPGDMRDVAALVNDLSEALGLKKIAILGWSWGGLVAQATLLHHPELVSHAIIVGSAPPGRSNAPIQPSWLERALKPVNDLADEEILFFEPKSEVSREAARKSHERIYARPGVATRIPSALPEIQAYLKVADGVREDVAGRREALTKTRIPILVLCGDNDPSVPAANWYPLIGRIPRGQFIVLPESGHGPQHQYPELSAHYITAFLRDGR